MSLDKDIEDIKNGEDSPEKRYFNNGKTFVQYFEFGEYVPEEITFKKYENGYQLVIKAYNDK